MLDIFAGYQAASTKHQRYSSAGSQCPITGHGSTVVGCGSPNPITANTRLSTHDHRLDRSVFNALYAATARTDDTISASPGGDHGESSDEADSRADRLRPRPGGPRPLGQDRARSDRG